MTDGLLDEVTDGDTPRPLGFRWLPGGFAARLAAWSAAGPVAFLAADCFGGVGEQRAAVRADGALAPGPPAVGEDEPFSPAGSPVSRALRRLGATAHPGEDEFASVGLHRRRHDKAWMS